MYMVDSIDDIATQARQGSVSAIIQILNEKLSDSGVRTRAIFSDGTLQLLCEAANPDQLEQPTLVDRVRQILESLQPKNIRRININSRIVREQQLLWFEEISRDPENQLLWSEQITLARPNPVKRLLEDLKMNRSKAHRAALAQKPAPRKEHESRLFWRGIIGGASLSLLLLLVGWAVSDWLGLNLGDRIPLLSTTEPEVPEPAVPSPEAVTPSPIQDPFSQAVWIAEQAVVDGQTAETPAEWLDLASRWQRASDLMAQVSPNDNRFATAQNRIGVYRQNSEMALQRAQQLRSPGTEESPTSPTSPATP